jgi:hypothetical protein
MTKEQAIKYLENVLKNWSEFCNGHRPFALAIKVLLQEVQKNDMDSTTTTTE